MINNKIAFIGCGNMSSAIIGGLLGAGCSGDNIIVSNPTEPKLNVLKNSYPVVTTTDNIEAASFAEIILLSVKPQKMAEVCRQLSSLELVDKLIISIAAGFQTDKIVEYLKQKQKPAVVRCMPNTPALIGQGATGLFATGQVTDKQRKISELIFRAVGQTSWIAQESQMNIVTAIAGSSPAYFFLMMQAMIDQAVMSGLSEKKAFCLITQAASGAALLAQSNPDLSLIELRKKVTSPGGTTSAAIEFFQQENFEEITKNAVKASIDRGVELGKSET